MVVSTRMLGIKMGLTLSLLALAYLSQTTLNLFGLPKITNYINIVIPTELYGYNLVIIAWVLFVIGLIMFFMGVFDIPPFDF